MPPIILDLIRGTTNSQGSIWKGVYERHSSVPTREGTFDERLIGEMSEAAARALKHYESGGKPYLWHEHLALVASMIAAETGQIRILDFGGGIGSGFLQLLSSLPSTTKIEYLIVDLEQMCNAGRKIFANDERIHFVTTLPPSSQVFDLVYVNSVLQYIEDYKTTLENLACVGSPFLLLTRLAAGDFPTFATQQINVPEQIFPFWFLNVQEVNQILRGSGYEVASDFLMERVYDQSKLPITHRAERMRNMLFRKAYGTQPV